MLIYPDDRVLVAIMNNPEDWRRVQEEHWYRIPVKHAPPVVPHVDWVAFFFTQAFGNDKWAIHYYSKVEGHELVTRKELFPAQPDHKRAGDWYYKLQLGPLHHKLPPITAGVWRRIAFIFTTGDRFEAAQEIKDLYADESSAGYPFVILKEQQGNFEGDENHPNN
jgi:hypothetical protein